MGGISDRYGRDLFFKINPIEIDEKTAATPILDNNQSASHKQNTRDLLKVISNPANLDLAKSSLEVGRDIEEISLENFEDVHDHESDIAKESSILNYDMKIEFASFPESKKNAITFDELVGSDSEGDTVTLASGYDGSHGPSSVDDLDLSDITLEDSIADKEEITEFASNRNSLQKLIKEKPASNAKAGNIGSLEQELQRVRKDLASLQAIIKQHGIPVSTDIQIHADDMSEYEDTEEVLEEIGVLEAEDIDTAEALDTESIETLDTESIEALDTESIETLGTESIEALDTESIEALDNESTAVLDTESTAVLDTESTAVLDNESTEALDHESTEALDTESTAVLDTESTAVLDTESTAVLHTESTEAFDIGAPGHEEHVAGSVDAGDVKGTPDTEQPPPFYGHANELNKREEENMRHIVSSADLEALDKNSAHANEKMHIVEDTDVMEHDDILLHIDTVVGHVDTEELDVLLSSSDYTLEEIIPEGMHERSVKNDTPDIDAPTAIMGKATDLQDRNSAPTIAGERNSIIHDKKSKNEYIHEDENAKSNTSIAGISSVTEDDTNESITSDTAVADNIISHRDDAIGKNDEIVKVPDTEDKIVVADEAEVADSSNENHDTERSFGVDIAHEHSLIHDSAPETIEESVDTGVSNNTIQKEGKLMPIILEHVDNMHDASVISNMRTEDGTESTGEGTADPVEVADSSYSGTTSTPPTDDTDITPVAQSTNIDEPDDAIALDDDPDDTVALDEIDDAVALDEPDDVVILDEPEDAVMLDEPDDAVALDEPDDTVALDEPDDVAALDDEPDDAVVALDEPDDAVVALDDEPDDAVALDEVDDAVALDDEPDDAVALDEPDDAVSLDDEPDDAVVALDDEPDDAVVALDDEPDDAVALDDEPDDAVALDDEPDNAVALDDDPDDAVVALDDEPDDAVVALDDDPDDAVVALDDEPDDAVALDDEPDDAVALDDEPDNAVALDDDPDDAVVALDDEPDDAIALDDEPDDAVALDDEPDDAVALDEVDDAVALDDEPDDAIALDDDPDDTVAALDDDSDDAIVLDDEPDDAVAALDDEPDDAVALDDEPDDAIALDDEPDDAVALDDEPDDAIALDDEPDDAIALDDEEKDSVTHTSALPKHQKPTTITLNKVDSDELRTIIKYMDKLLEQLPKDTVEEFAHSKYFGIYERLFEDLEMKDF